MGLTKEQAISQYGTESYTGWGETEAAADAKAKGISAGSGSSVSGLNSTGDVSNYLDSTQQQLYSKIQQQLGEIPTQEEVIEAITPDQQRPDLISRTQILEEQKTKYGVTDLETELTNINTEINTINATLRETKAAEEGKPVALGVMAGRMTEEERQAATKMDYLNVRKQTLVDQISTAYTAINMYITYAGQDYQDAVTSYNTEFEQNLSIQNTLSSLRSERLGATKDVLDVYSTAKQQAINNAQANLTTIINAISKGNMKYDSLSADEKLNIQKLEIQSGLPVGTVSNLQLAPSDKILGWSDDKTQP
jgi:glutamate synthase domain-containing protein 2